MITVHAVTTTEYGLAGSKKVPSETYPRSIEKRSAGRTRERRLLIDFVPKEARERRSIDRPPLPRRVGIRVPSREAKAGIVTPWSQMRHAQPVIQGETPRHLPGIGPVKFLRQVAEGRDHVEVQLVVLGHLANQHVGICIAS